MEVDYLWPHYIAVQLDMQDTIHVDPKELAPVGRADSDSAYFLYTRKQHGLWTSINMGLFYILLVFLALWGKEYILLGMMVLLVIILLYDQMTNREFLEINETQISYYLPYMSYGRLSMDDIAHVVLSPNQIRLQTASGSEHCLEIHSLLSAKKKRELRSFLQGQFANLEIVDR